MSTQKNDKPKELIPINDLVNLDKVNLDEISDRLWHEYFDPKEKHTPEVKKFIMQQYNIVVDKMNKQAGFKRQINITSSLLWSNKLKDNPDIKASFYVEVNWYEKKDQRLVKQMQIASTVINAAQEIVHEVVKGIGKTRKPYPGNDRKPVAQGSTNGVRAGSDKWLAVYDLHLAGNTNEQIMNETGYTAKQVRDAIYRYKTNRVKGAQIKP